MKKNCLQCNAAMNVSQNMFVFVRLCSTCAQFFDTVVTEAVQTVKKVTAIALLRDLA